MTNSINTPVNFTFNIGAQDKTGDDLVVKDENSPFCMAIMGDFSGRKNKPITEKLSQRAFKLIDSYDYDEVLAGFGINLQLDMGNENVVTVPINKFKDFHPDQLYKNVSAFATLRDLRKRLQNNATFDKAASEIQGWLVPADEPDIQTVEPAIEVTSPEVTGAEPVATDNLLDSILEETVSQSNTPVTTVDSAGSASKKESLVEGFIQQMMANRVKVSAKPRKDEMLAAVDDSISELMRSILHHPDYQTLESTWQAVRFLVRRIKSGKRIKLFLLDVTKDEMNQDLSIDDVTQSSLYAMLTGSSFGDIDWSLIVGDCRFSDTVDDILLLSQLGFIAKNTDAVFISAADEKLVGCESFETTPDVNRWDYDMEKNVSDAWSLLRQSDIAQHISLALPSFLIREPYSPVNNPIKSFSFDEMLQSVQHSSYLWANAAYFKAEQFARAFMKDGWNMQMGEVTKTGDLPMYAYEEKGKTIIKPCAEISLTDVGAVRIQEQGIIPLWTVKDSDRIYSGEFYSLAYQD